MVLLLLFLIFPFSLFAADQTSEIYINEFQIEPIQQVELVNRGASNSDISGWYIDDDGGTTYYTIPEGTILAPNSCIVVEGKFNLNKSSSDTVRLFDNTYPPTATLAGSIDSYTYAMSPGEALSFQRMPDGSTNWIPESSNLGSWNNTKTSCQLLPSPIPTATSFPVPTPTLTPTESPPVKNIIISEAQVYPDSGEHEWIELYNPNNYNVTLLNWYIDDISDAGASPKKFTLLLPANGYAVYELTTGMFNNDGDSVRLLNNSDFIVDSFFYLNAEKSLSVGRSEIDSESVCQMEPTKGYENTGCIEMHTPSQSPMPTVATGTPSDFPINENSTSEGTFTSYTIGVSMPVPSTSEILGTADYINPSGENRKPISFLKLSPLYSLLSIISLTVKMKLK